MEQPQEDDRISSEVELRVRVYPGDAQRPWRAVVSRPDGAAPRQFESPTDLAAYLRECRRSGLR